MILYTEDFKRIGDSKPAKHIISFFGGEIEFIVTRISDTEYEFKTTATPREIKARNKDNLREIME